MTAKALDPCGTPRSESDRRNFVENVYREFENKHFKMPGRKALTKHNLSPEEEKRLGQLFDQLDINRDGKIDIRDLSGALHQLRVPQVPGQAQVSKQKGF